MSGTKRPYEGESSDRQHKARDWKEAFFADEQPRRDHGSHRDRDRHADNRRSDDRYGDRYDSRHRDHRDRYDDRRGGERDRSYHDRDHVGGSQHRYRDRDGERDGHYRHHGDHRDHRNGHDRSNRSERGGSARRSSVNEREEGEYVSFHVLREGWSVDGRLDPSPPKPTAALPRASPSVSPRKPVDRTDTTARGFQPVSIPTGPRGQPQSTRNPLEPSQKAAVQEEPVVVLEEETDPEKVMEERRRRRAEIMAKFKATGGQPAAPPTPEAQKLGTGADSVTSGGARTTERGALTGTSTGAAAFFKKNGIMSSAFLTPNSGTPVGEPSLAPTPGGKDFDLEKHEENGEKEAVQKEVSSEKAGISAAEYDPTGDKKDDEEKRRKDATEGNGEPAPEPIPVEDEWEEVEIEEEVEDDDVDMFAAFGDEDTPKKKRKVTVRRKKNGSGVTEVVNKPKVASVLDVVDNVDDTDGYYRITPGEILDDGRYQITITLGKGMFSAVVKAKVLKAVDQERRQDVVGKEVAIKVIRSQESMYVAGRKEAQILKKLNDADPEDKKHVVRMDRTFEHRGHLCIVTESLSMNLRDVIKRFGKDVGLDMRAVRAYAHQMFLALSLFRKCNVVHADIKPDNILVTENKATLKVCDLGSAADVSEGEITPYLVSRFYRAPEIILGLPHDTAIDVWSVACTLYELYTGKILFPGRSNNHMLFLMMEVKGKLNHRMIKKASLGEMHFDENMNFISVEKDKITGQDVLKTLSLSKATRDLKSRLLPPSSVQLKMKDDELKQLHNFVDLLEKCLHLDPAKRMTPYEALRHPFLAGH